MYRSHRELSRSYTLINAIKKFNENVQILNSHNLWWNLVQIFAELMKAQHVLLFVFDEQSNSLVTEAVVGLPVDAIKNEEQELDTHIAERVLHDGRPLLISDVENTKTKLTLFNWKYKSKSFISYPIEIAGRKIGVINFIGKTDGESYDAFDLDLLATLIPQGALLVDRAELIHKTEELEQLSITDPLTGLFNRRYLKEHLTEEIERSKRHNFPLSFMMIDVDNFKSYNDNFSHPEGDNALQIIAHCLKETVRTEDIAARYGGEEFSILLPQTSSTEALIIAERLRSCVASSDFPFREVTISIGVASISPSVYTVEHLIRAADQALYEAKHNGRNKVEIFEDFKLSSRH
jgi:diguanylate cyclase (GGDEF)-like protein